MKQGFQLTVAPIVTFVMTLSFGISAGVIAYWDFGSDSNGVTDVSGNCHSLTNSGVVISNGVAIFNGSQTNFSTVSTLDLRGYNSLTLEFFMRTAGTNAGMMILEQTSQYFGNTGAFMVDVNETNAAGQVMGGFCNNSVGTKLNLDSTPTGTASGGQWHHVAVVCERTKTGADRSMLYFDGLAQGSYGNWTNSDTLANFCNGRLYIGSRGNSSMKFAGELDDVRISDTALATNQFLQARTAGEIPPVIAHWRFDEGASLSDSSGNGNSLAGSGVVFTNGIARFDGNHTLGTAGTLNLTAWTNLTVEFFMRTTSTSTMAAIEHTANFGTFPGAFFVDVNDGFRGRVIGGNCTVAGSKYNLDTTGTNAVGENQWHHVAVVYNKAKTGADRSMLYFDGVAQGTFNSLADSTAVTLRNATLFIGSRNNTSLKYTGEMDDIRITGAALQPGQFLKAPSTELPRVIAYWPFSGRKPLSDATGNGHALTNMNAGVTFAEDAAVFNGSQATFSTRPWTLNLRPYPALTVEYFIRTAATNKTVLLEHSANFSTYRGGFIAVLNEFNPGQIESGVSMPGASTFNIDSTAANAVSDGIWHHVALVYDPAGSGDNRVRVYLDRIQQGKRIAGSNISDAETFFLNDVLFIGMRENDSVKFIGELDDIKITGAVLTPAEFMEKRTYYGGSIIMLQ